MTPDENRKYLACILAILLVSVSLASAVPVVTPPSVTTPGKTPSSEATSSVATPQTEANGPNVPSFLAKGNSFGFELLDPSDPMAKAESEPVGKNVSISAEVSALEPGMDEINTDVWRYIGRTSAYQNWNSNRYRYWTFRYTGVNGRYYRYDLTAPRSDLDLYLQKWNGYRYVTIRSSRRSNSYESLNAPLYRGQYYRIMVYRDRYYPGWMRAYLTEYYWR